MAQTSFAIMTTLGRSKEAAALANATTITITHIAIGDGATVPSGGETALYNEVARKTIIAHGTVVGAENTAFFDAFLAADDGPYTIREAGLIDDEGDLIAIAHYDPPISKPVPASGQTVEGTVRLEVAFSDVANITIKVDPAMKVALQRLTRLPWVPVISMSLATPPSSPAVGDTYVIAADPTGSWAGQAGKIAEYTVAGWAIIAPPDGHGISLPDGRVFERIAGAYVEKLALDVQSGKWVYAVAGGTANALTVNLTPTPAALVDGMAVQVRIATTNTAAAPTLNVNGLGAKSIQRADGSAVQPGDLVAGATVAMTYVAGVGVWRCPPSLRSDVIRAALKPPTIVRLTTAGSSTWTVPTGVEAITIECWGGGGGGGYNGQTNQQAAPAGGGGGAYVKKNYLVTPGQVVSYTVGAGGLGGAASPARSGQNGTASSVTIAGATMTAGGGDGGLNPTGSSGVGNGGSGGAATGGDVNIDGGTSGGGRRAGGDIMLGSVGGASPMGGQGSGGGFGGIPATGLAPGGGGGSTSDNTKNGSAGATGEVRITYLTP